MDEPSYKIPFPTKKIADKDVYVCYQHGNFDGLILPTEEIAILHYKIDHERNSKN